MEQYSDEWFDGFETFNSDSVQESNIIELLIGGQLCPLCGCAYDEHETRLVRERDITLTLAVQCHCCGTGSLVTVERESQPMLSAHTELSPVERAFFAYQRPISHDDVARMRALLEVHIGRPARFDIKQKSGFAKKPDFLMRG